MFVGYGESVLTFIADNIKNAKDCSFFKDRSRLLLQIQPRMYLDFKKNRKGTYK